MTVHDDTRDRLIALEVQVRHLTASLKSTHDKVDEMHALLMQARGARWFIVGLAGVAGFLAALATNLAPWFGLAPK